MAKPSNMIPIYPAIDVDTCVHSMTRTTHDPKYNHSYGKPVVYRPIGQFAHLLPVDLNVQPPSGSKVYSFFYTDYAGLGIPVDSAVALRTVKTEMLVPVKHWILWGESGFFSPHV